MTAPPGKIKAILAKTKERLLDQEASAEEMYKGLLSMELALRGVVVQDENRLWQQVQSSIGKALLSEGSAPKPLLAGVNVMAGRVAEACPPVQEKPKELASALQRAKEIEDERFMILLQQEFDPLEVAQGYFSRAASIQSDTPPMWKKLWDLWIRRTNNDPTPFEAQVALENLLRIASSKGNTRRVAELQLRLILCYLNTRSNVENATSLAFGDSTMSELPVDPQELAERAEKTLQECNINDLVDDDKVLYQVLQVQVGIALETATIETMANQQHTADKNRSLSTSMSSSLESCRQVVLSQPKDTLQEVAKSLRDTVVAKWTDIDRVNTSWLRCIEWIQIYIVRSNDRAQAQMTTNNSNSWETVLNYVLPLLDAVQEQCNWNIDAPRSDRLHIVSRVFASYSSQESSLVSLLASSLPKIYWAALECSVEPIYEKMTFAIDLLTVSIQQCSLEKNVKTNAIGSRNQETDENRKLKLARSMGFCFVCQEDSDIIFRVTREGIANKHNDNGSLGFLQCLVAWSGWFQRPWPFCSNVSDARRLLAAASTDVGRHLTPMEGMLLDLAHSDAELLNGGFVEDAGKLYLKVLQKLEDQKSSLDNFTWTILTAHCNNGLARVWQMGILIATEVSVGELVQKNLDALDALTVPKQALQLHIWNSDAIFSSSISYQLSVARQLMADSLIREGRYNEAQSFLQAAVDDSPFDADAALALGAFLLRMAFYEKAERCPNMDKAAQVQLLKAAKLDPSQANPFALLGLWFEEIGDEKRASGCYSKALDLDPCNPIAGRGLLRLQSSESMKGVLDAAINSNSPVNGWAWRAVGLNKVFLDAEDEFAVVSLLKALRCRDIALPENEPLGNFYRMPKCEKKTSEKVDGLAEVAMCYRRLGRFTAAIRAYHAAIEIAGDNIASSVLCSCAQGKLTSLTKSCH